MKTAILLLAIILGVSAKHDAYICEVAYKDFCPNDDANCKTEPFLTLDGTKYSLTDNFNVIALENFIGDTSDTEGRLATRGDFKVDGGYSVGELIHNKGINAKDAKLPYSMVVGGKVTNWPSGRLYPDGAGNQKFPNDNEYMYAGSVETKDSKFPSYLRDRRTNKAPSATMDAEWEAALQYYAALSDAFALLKDNAQSNYAQGQGIKVTCADFKATSYVTSVDAKDWSKNQEGFVFTNCNSDAQLIFNIRFTTTAGVVFKGTEISKAQRTAEKTLYNIVGSGKTVYVGTTNGVNSVGGSVRGSILAPRHGFASVGGYIEGISIFGKMSKSSHQFNRVKCAPRPKPDLPSPPVDLCLGFETDCKGLTQSIGSETMSFRDFNAIAFNNFKCATGDVEGRVAVGGNVNLGAGYSIGYELSTVNDLPDKAYKYSLVAGGDVSWISGSIHPDGSGRPHAGEESGMFVGGDFSGADYLSDKVFGTCATPKCLDAAFAAAKTCYDGYSSLAASKKDNVKQEIIYSGLSLTCNNKKDTEYVVTITPETMSKFTYYVTSKCNQGASWIINVAGTGDVKFSGDNFPAPNGAVIYNVIGARTIGLDGGALNGHLLAPDATLNQVGGVFLGKVIVKEVTQCLQINKHNECAKVTSIHNPLVTPVPCEECRKIALAAGDVVVGDEVVIGDEPNTVTAVEGDTITLQNAVTVNAGNIGYSKVASDDNRVDRSVEVEATNSASVASVAFVLIAVLALLF